MSLNFENCAELSLSGKGFPRELALSILEEDIDMLQLSSEAGKVRMTYFDKKVKVHQINNIQNGLCPEDCGYCGQSRDSKSEIKKYGLKKAEDLINGAIEAKENGAYRYCMVASGRGPTDKRVQDLAKTIETIKKDVGIKTCLSVGLINGEQARVLKNAGLDRLNHNLNTSENHTKNIVTTHTYQDRVDTLKAARGAGLGVCSGIIVGMGESNDDILDVAYQLKEFEVPSIPINFLVPIPGNPLYDFNQLHPAKCLKILCVFRFINPDAEIRMGGGREGHLRGLQALALYPANSLFVEGYLVTRGDKANKTIRMIRDAGFEIEGFEEDRCELSSAEKYVLDEDPNIMNPKTAVVR